MIDVETEKLISFLRHEMAHGKSLPLVNKEYEKEKFILSQKYPEIFLFIPR